MSSGVFGLSPVAVAAGAVAVLAGAAICSRRCKRTGAIDGGSSAGARPAGVSTGVKLSELPPGALKEVKIASPSGTGVAVLLAHTHTGKVVATSANCPHANVSLAGGVLDGERIVCPAHAACFNACSGDIEDGPVLDKLATYKVNVAADGELLVELSAGWDKQVRGVKRDMCNHEPAADKRHFVIIGGGAAGAAASEELRARGFKGAITMVCKEACPPYERPKLSKSLGTEGRDVALRKGADEFYASKGITLRLGVAATRVSPSAKQVLLSDGSVLSYDKLLCATGGTPRRFLPGESFTTPGAGLGNVFPLRDADHSVAIAAAVEAITKAGGACPVVIVGSSFIGMETAAYLRNFAKLPDVTVVGMEGAPFERAMGPVVGDAFRRAFEAKGVKFRLGRPAGVVNSYNALDAAAGSASGAGAAASASAGVVGSVTLGDGTVLPARVVVIGAGVLPTTDYIDNEDAKGAGVDVRKMGPGEIGGVVVNSGMQTGNADIFAAGDMAQFPYTVKDASGAAHSHPWRIEHWDVAYDHGRVAAANMLGARDVVYDNVPFFWTGFFGVAVRSAGHAKDAMFPAKCSVIVHGNLDLFKPDGTPAAAAPGARYGFSAYYVEGGRVSAVVTAGAARDPDAAAALELMRHGAMPGPDALKDVGDFNLAAWLKAQAPALNKGKAAAAAAAAGDEDGAASGGAGAGARPGQTVTRRPGKGGSA